VKTDADLNYPVQLSTLHSPSPGAFQNQHTCDDASVIPSLLHTVFGAAFQKPKCTIRHALVCALVCAYFLLFDVNTDEEEEDRHRLPWGRDSRSMGNAPSSAVLPNARQVESTMAQKISGGGGFKPHGVIHPRALNEFDGACVSG